MDTTAIVLASTLAILSALDAWAIWRLFRSSSFSSAQRTAQTVLVLLLPFVGACVVLYFTKGADSATSGYYPVKNTDAEDVAFASDYDVGGHE